MALRFPPVSQFLERFRAVLRRRRVFDFDGEVAGLSRVEQAVAFVALLELRKAGEIGLSQAGALRAHPRHPRRERKDPPVDDRPLRLIATNPVDHLARTVEALLVVASQPLSVAELIDATVGRNRAGRDGASAARRPVSGRAQRDRAREGRGRLLLPRLARGGGRLRSPVRAPCRAGALAGGAGDALDRRLPGAGVPSGDRADSRRRGRLGRRLPRRARADRGGGTGERPWRRRPLQGDPAVRAGVRAREPRRAAAARRSRRRAGRDPRPAARRSGGARLLDQDCQR